MVQTIGWPSDFHYPTGEPESQIETDLDYLYNTIGCDLLIHGGDQMGEVGGSDDPPHITEQNVRDYWDMVDRVGAVDDSYAIPGNHDVPVPFWNEISAEYIGERVLTPKRLQPVDGLTILNISTQGGSLGTGGTLGTDIQDPWVPAYQVAWLYDEIDAAHTRGDIVIVSAHAPLWFGSNSNLASSHPQAPFSSFARASDRVSSGQYYVIRNFNQVMRGLGSRGPVVVMTGHDNHGVNNQGGSAEVYEDILSNGIYHVWQNHYAFSDNNRLSWIDADPSTGNVKVKSVTGTASGSRSTTTIMDVTPSW